MFASQTELDDQFTRIGIGILAQKEARISRFSSATFDIASPFLRARNLRAIDTRYYHPRASIIATDSKRILLCNLRHHRHQAQQSLSSQRDHVLYCTFESQI